MTQPTHPTPIITDTKHFTRRERDGEALEMPRDVGSKQPKKTPEAALLSGFSVDLFDCGERDLLEHIWEGGSGGGREGSDVDTVNGWGEKKKEARRSGQGVEGVESG